MIVKTWNCTGLSNKIKLRAFRQWLHGSDIVSLQETFIASGAVQFPGYNHFLVPATYGAGGKKKLRGGLATLVSAHLSSAFNISVIEGFEFEGLESLCLKFDRLADRVDLPVGFIVLNVYVAAQPAQFCYSAFYFALEAFLSSFDVPVLVMGDFNAHLRVKHTLLPNARDRDFQEFMLRMGDAGFAHFPAGVDLDRPTFISERGCTVIDYFVIRGAPCSGYALEDITDKGHRSLRISVDWPSATVTGLRDRTSHRRHFRTSTPGSFFPDFSAAHGLHAVQDYIKAGLTCIFNLLILSIGMHFQVSRGPRGQSCSEPWHRYLSEAELRPLLSLESEVFGLLAGARLGEAPLGLTAKAGELRQLRRTLHTQATRRLFKDVDGSLDDPTRLWSLVKKFRVASDQGVLPIDTLVHHFRAVFNRTGDPVPVVFAGSSPRDDEVLDRLFTNQELEMAVRELSRGTAPGCTGIGNDVLLDMFVLPGAPEFLLSFFNACLEGAELPALWRCTEIFLLYKGKGPLTDPGSYRGIALMDSFLKLYERLLFARLAPWAAARGAIPDCQFGFRSGASTLDAIFVFCTLITKYVGLQGSQLFVALIDFQKAFPSVNRALLIRKLGTLGVSAKFCQCLCAIFYRNTFSIRSGDKVTCEFPVTTGLREGSVLSPLLFSLFISDIRDDVLRPFLRCDFLKRDPCLNSIPVPGLLYADDLVLFCLSGDLLRERLRRLAEYSYRNQLTVNVSKCEVVVFGRRRGGVGQFRYNNQVMPSRSSCKYLGVWLDADRTGRSLHNAIFEKFRAGVPVFFSICRRMKIARLDRVFSLAQALLFSLLYGAEFLTRLDVIRRCEAAWWSGVRKFYGLPNGVSNATLLLLFPRFSLAHRVLLGKVSLALRGLRRLDTILPEALIYDRGHLFEHHRTGFLQVIKDWGQQLGLPDLFAVGDRAEAVGQLAGTREGLLDSTWDTFARMPSTTMAAALLGSRANFYEAALAASRFTRLGLRVFLLTITGSLSLSYCQTRACHHCGVHFSFEHLMSCPFLGDDRRPLLKAAVEREDWRGFAVIILGRFEVFFHFFRGGNCDQDVSELFEALNTMSEVE